ncbi:MULTISPECIES: hypothetical protein [unclassified Streptomyces]|uniref:hypothetical protein n=1 Tax=unclassified Streptomyces TaxID=2593676 RepID=UPI001BEB0D99|nr:MULTISPECIES: hypothetical protein [unclassified Streptomyces]MBT2405544.1 hypothetical protein [Streptomyces sp. ISL-21]MBT2607777.1 hypothetical protein [Streptomyces sp. ISL-87]
MRLTGRTATASAAADASRRKTVGLATAFIALAGMTLAGPATAAEHRAAAPSGDYCNASQGFYGGNGQYTYAEAQVCLRFASGGKQVIVNNNNSKYYWGGSWYDASSSYTARWRATGVVSINGQSGVYDTGTVTQGSVHGSASGGYPPSLGACGTYNVTMMFHQNGPYWTDDSSKDIDSGEQSYSISVAC